MRLGRLPVVRYALLFAALSLTLANAARADTIPHPGAVQLAIQNAEAAALGPKSVVAFQPRRAAQRLWLPDGRRLTLTALQPLANAWFLLEILDPGVRVETYHLENPAPQTREVALSDGPAPAIILTDGGTTTLCRPWQDVPSALDRARAQAVPVVPLCDGELFLRSPTEGSRTTLERTAEFLRDKVWFGESVVGLVKNTLYKDRYLASGDVVAGADPGRVADDLGRARLRAHPVMYTTMTFELVNASPERMEMGAWYAVAGAPGIYASALQPRMIAPDILNRPEEANPLDPVEGLADVYLVGFDLSRFDLGFEIGTEHPRVDWSPRPSGPGHDWSLPGPDGFDTIAPLARVGMVNPDQAARIAATFTGGFKRSHGAFRFGPMATQNHGHHYGFVVQGVVLSKLQHGLATLYVLNDGRMGMKTWTHADDALLPRIRFARQNGVALIEPDPETGAGVPGPLVTNWLHGNWSGSDKAELRTLRAGACLKTSDGAPFLIYGWFSTATPSSMARVFQAYGCDYAMLLDMNAVEHTYMALYADQPEGGRDTRYLVSGMRKIDLRGKGGGRLPRFVAYPDNRDFFYLLRKDPAP